MIKLITFGYKHRPGVKAPEVDCREFRNPHSVPQLRDLDGRHPDVQNWLLADPKFAARVEGMVARLSNGGTYSFGCVGGRHRSVAMAELVARSLTAKGRAVTIEHMELSK